MPRPRALARAGFGQSRVLSGIPEVDNPEPEADAPAVPLPSPVAAVEPEPVLAQPERTPARQRLAEMIEARRALAAEIAAARTTVEEAERRDLDASSAFYKAERAFDRAQPGHQPRAPLGDDEWSRAEWVRENSELPLPVAEARAAMDAAKDEKDTARRALEFHKVKLDELTRSFDHSQWRLDGLVKAVVASDPAIPATLAEARRLFLAFQDMQRVVERLRTNEMVDRSAVMSWNVSPSYTDPAAWPFTGAWAAAIEALASDPDAPLPVA